MRGPRILSASLVVLGLCSGKAPGQARRATAPAVAPAPLDTASTRVRPEALTGISTLYERLRSRPKSEFESWDAYLSRIAPPGGFGFYALPVSCTPDFSYDADSQQMAVSMHTTSDYYTEAIVAGCVIADGGSYVGSNAFGVKARVRRRTALQYAVRPIGRGSMFDPHASSYEKWTMAPEDAAREKPYLRVLLVIRPAAMKDHPLTYTDTDYDGPTIDAPTETTTYIRGLSADQIFLWVYSTRTYQVLKKIRLHGEEGAEERAQGVAEALGRGFAPPPPDAQWIGDPAGKAAFALACDEGKERLQLARAQEWTPAYFKTRREAEAAGYAVAMLRCSMQTEAPTASTPTT